MGQGRCTCGICLFCDDDKPKSGLARDLGDRLQSRNVPFGTSGDCDDDCENYDRRLIYEDIIYFSRMR